MNPALIVLNPRAIPECIEAIEALEIPKCWISYMREPNAATNANWQIKTTNYSHYIVLSDDTAPTQNALDLVLEQLEHHPVVTGYCNMDQNQNRHIVNLTTNVLPPPPPEVESYRFVNLATVAPYSAYSVMRSSFAGLALTAMSRDMWLRFPLTPTSYGGQMDYQLSYDLQEAGIPIVAAVGAYVEHVKERWNFPDKNPEKRLLIGEREPEVRWS